MARRRSAAVGAVCAAWLMAGCAVVTRGLEPGARSVRAGDPGGPFAPASVRLAALTGLDVLASGERVLRVHLELRDAWGDVVKGSGRLELSLVPADAGASVGVEPTVYDVDLRDLELNARLYDPATRTYRVTLEDLPRWAVEGSAVLVLARLFTPGADGAPDELRDRLVVR